MFKPGDVVQLSSGGPQMTICNIIGQWTVECAWFVGGELRRAEFDLLALSSAGG